LIGVTLTDRYSKSATGLIVTETIGYDKYGGYFAAFESPPVGKQLHKSANARTKVQEHFERANARPEGWSTGCA